MNIKSYISIVVLGLGIISCGGDSGGNTPTTTPTPGKTVLIGPANARTCEDGSNITLTQSTVNFSWNSSTNTETYDLKIVNLNTQEVISQAGLNTTSKAVTLTRGIPYSWTVTSKNKGTTTTTSDIWKFYLAGNGVANYAPFPAAAINPLPGASVTPVNQKITLTWDTSDVEGTALTYSLYFDTVDGKQTLLDVNKNLTTKSKEVAVAPNTVYYWRVVTSDGTNISTSTVYSFKVL